MSATVPLDSPVESPYPYSPGSPLAYAARSATTSAGTASRELNRIPLVHGLAPAMARGGEQAALAPFVAAAGESGGVALTPPAEPYLPA